MESVTALSVTCQNGEGTRTVHLRTLLDGLQTVAEPREMETESGISRLAHRMETVTPAGAQTPGDSVWYCGA